MLARAAPTMRMGVRAFASVQPMAYRRYLKADLKDLLVKHLGPKFDWQSAVAVSHILPFQTNNYVVERLLDWDKVQTEARDPLYNLNFPVGEMLPAEVLAEFRKYVTEGADPMHIAKRAAEVRETMNPHDQGQFTELNLPRMDGELLDGVQHKYQQCCLYFPRDGQQCLGTCAYCFRWGVLNEAMEGNFSSVGRDKLHEYLRRTPQIRDLLITGGDSMSLPASVLAGIIEPLLDNPNFEHIRAIRLGTKTLTYWPYRFLTDPDAGDMLKLFEKINKSGKTVAIMAHNSHYQEWKTPEAEAAIAAVKSTGSVVRAQSPIVRTINDSAECWSRMWQRQVSLGVVPYYMFIPRETGPMDYFRSTLDHALTCYTDAIALNSGLARTARGPSMTINPGKLGLMGKETINGEETFVFKFFQARKPEWMHKVFFAKFDPNATFFDQLVPAFGEKKWFFEDEQEEMSRTAMTEGSSGQRFCEGHETTLEWH
jgi:L-lysine 2,3-aminomutase